MHGPLEVIVKENSIVGFELLKTKTIAEDVGRGEGPAGIAGTLVAYSLKDFVTAGPFGGGGGIEIGGNSGENSSSDEQD